MDCLKSSNLLLSTEKLVIANLRSRCGNLESRRGFSLVYKEGDNKNPRVWQQSFYDEVIQNEKDFMNKLNYIYYNPVKAGLVEMGKNYPFSSYHQYNGAIRNAVQVAIEYFE